MHDDFQLLSKNKIKMFVSHICVSCYYIVQVSRNSVSIHFEWCSLPFFHHKIFSARLSEVSWSGVWFRACAMLCFPRVEKHRSWTGWKCIQNFQKKFVHSNTMLISSRSVFGRITQTTFDPCSGAIELRLSRRFFFLCLVDR